MKLYIGNGLHQNVDFQYRLKGYKTYRTQVIPIGSQIQISGDLQKEEIDKIIIDHFQYGMMNVRDFRNYKGIKIPYIYSVDEPISFESLQELIVQNRDFNEELGVKLRQDAAVAVSKIIEDNTPDIPGVIKRQLTNLEMEIQEVGTKNRDAVIHGGVRVTRERNLGAPQGPSIIEKVANFARPGGSLF